MKTIEVKSVKTLEALKPSQAGSRVKDGGSMFGFVRATKDPTSPVSVDFQWRYKTGGKLRQVRLGAWPKMSLKAIRDYRDVLAAENKTGSDPIERKATERLKKAADQAEAIQNQYDRLAVNAEKQARLTVKGLFILWQGLALKQRKDGGKEALRAFELDVFPLIGNVAAVDVTKAHIQAIVDSMMLRDVVRMTKRVLSDLRQMFGFALDRELIQIDPTARLKKAAIGKDTERERVLSERELIDLINKLPASGLVKTSQAALMIQLATLTRIGEVLGAKWCDVDFERRTWTLPHTKNGKPHTISLSDFALSQLEGLKSITGGVAWLFPNSALNGPLNDKAVTKQVADRQRDGEQLQNRTKQTEALKLSGGRWTPHDLRRTGATHMGGLGVVPAVIERCLNHTESNKLKRTYQLFAYEAQMRDAWQLWGERLELLLNKPENVVTLKAA
jgi:integrase